MWEAFKDLIFLCIQAVYHGVGDWGAAILIVTIIFRLLLTPLMHKQIKSTYATQKLQPKIQKIQETFKDDQVRMNEEVQKLYAEAHFNPLAGCLPLLLQMPIFMALFQVLREMGTRTGSSTYEFYNLVSDLTQTPSGSWAVGLSTFVPYFVLMLIFAGATFLPMVLQQIGQPNNPQRRQTLMMSAFMTVFMLWIGWRSPAGVLLFWGASSVYGVTQQQITMHMLKKRDAKAEEEVIDLKPVEVNVTRKAKKKRPKKSH